MHIYTLMTVARFINKESTVFNGLYLTRCFFADDAVYIEAVMGL